ncbi:MAG TPA: hypothetical protein VKA48_06425 [Gammaproteobacteria bacterium]|nr:hypothetical protein [Gammaproteobacteria bacterium]
MPEQLEGLGHLFAGQRPLGPVRYRLCWSAPDPSGRRGMEGTLLPAIAGGKGIPCGRFLLRTEAGFSLTLEVLEGSSGEGFRFRRVGGEGEHHARA